MQTTAWQPIESQDRLGAAGGQLQGRAGAQADRDAAGWEAEEQRRRAGELEAQLRASTIHAEQQAAAAAEANSGWARARARVSDLSKQVLQRTLAQVLQIALRKDLGVCFSQDQPPRQPPSHPIHMTI